MKGKFYKLLSCLFVMTCLVPFISDFSYRNIVAIITFGVFLFVSYQMYGKSKDNNFNKWPATRLIIAVLLAYLIGSSLLGIILGFNRTLFSFDILNLFRGLVPTSILVFISEYLRFLLIKKNALNKRGIYLLTIIMMIFNVAMNLNIAALDSANKVFIFVCTVIIPTIANEALCSYLAYNYGFLPTIVYKMAISIYVYILPITTDLGDYLYSAIHVFIPFTIYMLLGKYLNVRKQREREERRIKKIDVHLIVVPTVCLLAILMMLVSGHFKYQLVAIMSDSMMPVYGRGDAIIYEKINPSEVQIGDIVVFKDGKRIVTHRIVKIKDNMNVRYYYTKGDSNTTNDSGYITKDEIMGVVRYVTKYIGYPTVWINSLFGGD